MALLAAAPSWRLRASFRRDQSFPSGRKPTLFRRPARCGWWPGRAARHCPRDSAGLGPRSLLLSQRTSRERTRRTKWAVWPSRPSCSSPSRWSLLTVPSVPPGFQGGPSGSAPRQSFFLVAIGRLRLRRPLGAQASEADGIRITDATGRFVASRAGLFVIAFVFACATWKSRVAVGRSLGSMVLRPFRLGGDLALVNILELAVSGQAARGGSATGRGPASSAPMRSSSHSPRRAQCVAASVPSGGPL